jgi:hypothetical protein
MPLMMLSSRFRFLLAESFSSRLELSCLNLDARSDKQMTKNQTETKELSRRWTYLALSSASDWFKFMDCNSED